MKDIKLLDTAIALHLQCQSLTAQITAEQWKGPKRYPPGTMVDGKNVGGQWMPSDKNGSSTSSSDVETTMALLNGAAQNVKQALAKSADSIAGKLTNPGFAKRMESTVKTLEDAKSLKDVFGALRIPTAKDWKTLLENVMKDLKRQINKEYRQTVEPLLRHAGKDSFGAKFEDVLDKSLQRLKVLDKSFTDELSGAAKEAFNLKKILMNVSAATALTGAIAGISLLVAPQFAIPIFLSMPGVAVETALFQPFMETITKAGLRFGGVKNKVIEEVASFIAGAVYSRRIDRIADAFKSRAAEKAAAEAVHKTQMEIAKKLAEESEKAVQEIEKVTQGIQKIKDEPIGQILNFNSNDPNAIKNAEDALFKSFSEGGLDADKFEQGREAISKAISSFTEKIATQAQEHLEELGLPMPIKGDIYSLPSPKQIWDAYNEQEEALIRKLGKYGGPEFEKLANARRVLLSLIWRANG